MGANGIRSFELGEEPAIMTVIDAALPLDRPPGMTRQDMLHMVDRLAGDPGGTVVATEEGRIVGYCTPRHDDLTVHPAHRRRGHGRRLVAAARNMLRDRGDAELILYGSPGHAAAAAFIARLGFTYRSSLWLFELERSVAIPAPSFPADIAVRTYQHADLDAVVAVATASFADHPTPVTFDRGTIAHVNSLPDFEPEGILLVFRRDEPNRPIAWTRTTHELREDGRRRGYVNMIGVLPEWRGFGLGRELLRWGITRLRDAGADTLELAVEAANERALGLYRRTGFVPSVEWPHWALPTEV